MAAADQWVTGAVAGDAFLRSESQKLFLSSGGTQSLVVNGANIGIGTTTPDEKLTLYGTSGELAIRMNNAASGGRNWELVSKDSSGSFSIIDRTGSGDRLLIDSSGRVGIGTTTPVAKLNVLSTTEQLRLSYSSSVYWSDTVASDGGRTLAGFGTDGDLNITFTGATDGDFSINSDDLFVDTSAGGLVGIGTAAPQAFLQIGSASNSLGGTAGNDLDMLTLQSGTSNTDSLLFTTERLSTGSDWTSAAHRIQRQVDATPMGYMQFGSVTTDLITFGENATEYMRIDGSGNVGIGTSTVLAQLHVDNEASENNVYFRNNSSLLRFSNSSGINFIQSATTNTAASAADLRFTNFGAGTTWMTIQGSTGNVGIGTTTPNQALSVVGNGYFSTGVFLADGQDFAWGDASTRIEGSGASDYIAFLTDGGAERMRVATGGNVGIGITAPNAQLSLGTSVNAIKMAVYDGGSSALYGLGAQSGYLSFGASIAATGTPQMVLTSLGNVGIGTTTPGYDLTVADDVLVGDEIISLRTSANANIRMVGGNYGAMFRNDGTNLYFLLTNSGDQLGAWNSLRPITINNVTGGVSLGTTTVNTTLTVTEDISANGTYYYGDSKPIVQYSDSWLRLNPTNAFTSGIYANTGIFRTDGTLQVGALGATLSVVSAGDFNFDAGSLFVQNSTNRVGFGTSSPLTGFDILNTSSAPANAITSAANGAVMIGSTDSSNRMTFGVVGGATAYGWVQTRFQAANGGASNFVINPLGGNVGIGTTTPLAKLDIYGTAGSSDLFAISSSTNARLFTIKASGFVGIGTSSPLANFSIVSTAGTDAMFIASSSGEYLFKVNQSGGTAIQGSLTVGGGISAPDLVGGRGDNTVCFVTSGAFRQTANANGCTNTSDVRLKENIEEADSMLANLLDVNVVNYNLINDDEEMGTQTGVIAQELYEIFPEMVKVGGDDPSVDPWGVGYQGFGIRAVKGIQDMHLELTDLLTNGTTTATSTFAHLLDEEKDTVWSRLVKLAQSFADGVLTLASADIEYVQTEQIKTNELCVGSVCVDENTFLEMVQSVNGAYAFEEDPEEGGGGSTDPVPEDTGTSTDPVIEEDPPVEEPPAEEVVEEPAPEEETPVEEPEPTPTEEPEPEPEPTPEPVV